MRYYINKSNKICRKCGDFLLSKWRRGHIGSHLECAEILKSCISGGSVTHHQTMNDMTHCSIVTMSLEQQFL